MISPFYSGVNIRTVEDGGLAVKSLWGRPTQKTSPPDPRVGKTGTCRRLNPRYVGQTTAPDGFTVGFVSLDCQPTCCDSPFDHRTGHETLYPVFGSNPGDDQ